MFGDHMIRALASLQLTVALLMLIAVALALGTILESLRGAEAARAVYGAPWFFGLEGLFALNIVAALWDRWPRSRWRIGFLITHVSVLLILGGALTTAAFTIEGRLPLWEGQSADRILRRGPGDTSTEHKLPFLVRLDAFEMDFYSGTQRPAMFRSRVTVRDGAGVERAAVIEMNRPLSHGGYQFFQSSYQIQDGREMSVLSVSKDPGQPIVFIGYGLLVVGMIVVMVTRIAQRGAPARAVVIAVGILSAGAADAAQLPSPDLTEKIRRLPVQHDGRVMPLDTQAREAVLTVTGQRTWKRIDPVAMAIGWTIDPRSWLDEPIVRVDDEIAALTGRPAARYVSYRALLSSERFLREADHALRREQAGQVPWPLDKPLLKAEERLRVLDSHLRGYAVRPLPAADRIATWQPPTDPASAAAWAELEGRIRANAPGHYPQANAIDLELRYNALRPTRLAWLLLLPAAIAAGLTLGRDRRRLRWVAGIGAVLGFLVMTWGIWSRWQIAGRIPASNMYESMLFLGWGVGLVGAVSLVARNRILIFNSVAMAALVMLLLDRLPIDPFIHPMPPVLSGTPWLAIHVPIIMVSYSVFAIAAFLAHLVLGVGIFAPSRRALAERWSDLLYWYLIAGSILLIAGILTGSVWAASSWGRYWGWDPKEVWSLVAFLAYMAILHARFDGQISSFGVAVSSIAAFWTILMTYLGVNFVLAAGLHSYGFGSSNLVRVMGVIALIETTFVLAGWWAHKKLRPTSGRRPRSGAPA